MKTFAQLVAEAVADMAEHGYDSQLRVDTWVQRIQQAANLQVGSQQLIEQRIRRVMDAKFRALISPGGAKKYHRGIPRFTLANVAPAARATLERRIVANAMLIKLNRQQAIAKTLQRFSGWATSIPAGGTGEALLRQEATNIRKSIRQLPFEERRVAIDQGHKLVAAVNQSIAEAGGAIAVMWRSNWRQPGYNYREDHKERDEHVYLLRDSWAMQRGLVKPNVDGFYDSITAVGEEPFCGCYGIWLYHLRQLPEEMLTAAGRDTLLRARQVTA